MLNHTKKMKELYEDIQRKIYYMIPEKWDQLYLYSSIIDMPDKSQAGELFFYYVPKGILRKNPINVYEIPAKFNLDESEYLKLVENLYNKIKELREEYRKSQLKAVWSNITITIRNMKFKIEYCYDDLLHNEFDSYERHVIWRYKYLGIGPEQVSKEDKEILRRFETGGKTLREIETYDAGIYIQDIKNIVDYDTARYDSTQNVEYVSTKNETKNINQILLSKEEIERNNLNK